MHLLSLIFLASTCFIALPYYGSAYVGDSLPEAVIPTPVKTKIQITEGKLLAEILEPNASLEILARHFVFTEGPVWRKRVNDLLFSDPNANRIYQWIPEETLNVYMYRSGYSGLEPYKYAQPGSNGLTLDREGRLIICQHGNRQVVRQENDGSLTVLASHFEGKRLNSPNDVVVKSDGSIYFTDPSFGLPLQNEDPGKELPYNGVYRIASDKTLTLLTKSLDGPNGLAFTPNESHLYVTNWNPKENKIIARFPVNADGTLGPQEIFVDVTKVEGGEAFDGIKIDKLGNVYAAGFQGVNIYSATAAPLGIIKCPELPANIAWGDSDGKTLYICGKTGLYRIKTLIGGKLP